MQVLLLSAPPYMGQTVQYPIQCYMVTLIRHDVCGLLHSIFAGQPKFCCTSSILSLPALLKSQPTDQNVSTFQNICENCYVGFLLPSENRSRSYISYVPHLLALPQQTSDVFQYRINWVGSHSTLQPKEGLGVPLNRDLEV